MRVSLLRTATLALALTAVLGVTSGAFAAPAQNMGQQQAANASPYDSPDFVIQDNNIHP